MMMAGRKPLGFALSIIVFLTLPFALSADDRVLLKVTSNPDGAIGYIEGLNMTFYTPSTLEIPKGEWILRITHGNHTVLYKLTASNGSMHIFVDFTNMRQSIRGPFINTTVKYGFNKTVPAREEEYVPFMPAPIWDGEVCGGIIMFGPRDPPMVIYKYDNKDPYYQLFLNSTPSIEEYRGRKGCKMIETIHYFSNDGSMARGFPYREASFIAPHSLLSIDSQPKNSTVYIFDFHRFGEWFTPFDVLVPVIMKPQQNVSVLHYDLELGNLTTTVVPYIPEIHAYKISIGYNGYPFFEGWLDLAPDKNYSVNVNLKLLKFALRVNGKPLEQHIEEKHETPKIYIPNTTLLIVNSTPSAEFFIDGRFLGKTPVEKEVPGGEHELGLRIAGRTLWRKTLNIGYGGRFRLTVYLEEYMKERGFVEWT